MRPLAVFFAVIFLPIASLADRPIAGVAVAELRCDQDINPLGVDVAQPRLSWTLTSVERGQIQTAYQVLVASKPTLLRNDQGDLWDSGRVTSDETQGILYNGPALASAQQVFWKVRVWDRSGREGNWSTVAMWTTGVLRKEDWHARWISDPDLIDRQRLLLASRQTKTTDPKPQLNVQPGSGAPVANPFANSTIRLRREFVVRPGFRRALVEICGLGQYELTLNGSRVGQGVLAPGWTDTDKTCLYDSHDVTSWLRSGPNVIGIGLAGGMYNVQEGRYVKFVTEFRPLTAIGQLRIEYADGNVEFVGTDEQWRVEPGPLTFCNVYGGEDYDARLDHHGWDSPGFDDRGWRDAVLFVGPKGQLRGHSRAAPPLATFEVLTPVSARSLRPGVVVYDVGQNASMMLRLKVKGQAGAVVRIMPAELLAADGAIDRSSIGGETWWQFTLAGTGATEEWRPRDFYQGARYLQVEAKAPEGGGETPTVDSIQGAVVHSNSAPGGQFSCSNSLFNRIHELVRWAQLSNLMSVLTDCPHRERLGWLEQTHLNGPALRYEFNLNRLMAKTAGDMADSQEPGGLVPDIAPEVVKFSGGFRDSPEWGSACVLVPWQQYEWTGDVELLRQSYPMMKRYVDYLSSRSTDHVVSYGLGDWYDLGPNPPGYAQLTPVALTATAFYFHDARILSRVANRLGDTAAEANYETLARKIRAAFNRTFFDPANGRYATGSQCANAIPLVMDLVEPARRPGVLDAIVADVRSHGNSLTAGDVGYRYLLRALADGGRSDVVFDMNNQSEKPGYGYQLAHGATSLTEAWDANRNSSQNHFMLGQINEWFYHDLAGIQGDPEGPGFHRIIIKPAIVGDLTWVRADYDSARGRIASTWKRTDRQLTLGVSIPVNTTATVWVPTKDAGSISEGVRLVGENMDVHLLRMAEGCAVYAIGSGNYEFTSTLP